MASHSHPKSKRRIKNPRSIPTLSSIEPPPGLLPSKAEFFKLIAVVTVAVSVAFGCNYVVKVSSNQPKTFCDSDIDFDSSSDACDPCPIHGICYKGGLECMSGYIRHGRSCLEDGDINEMAKNLAKKVESHVCESYSQYLCKGIDKVWVQGNELWNSIDEMKLMKGYGKDNATYLFAKQRAMEIADNILETRDTNFGIKELKCPELLVEHYKPLSCSIRLWILERALFLISFCSLFLGCALILLKVRQRHYLSVRAEELYEQVCETLEETALMSRSLNGEGEPWVVASWLRDNILTPRERRDPLLWKKVEELVQEDSRLDRYPKMLKGEAKVVWEWQVEGPLRSSGKKKGEIEIETRQKSADNSKYKYHKAGENLNLDQRLVQIHFWL